MLRGRDAVARRVDPLNRLKQTLGMLRMRLAGDFLEQLLAVFLGELLRLSTTLVRCRGIAQTNLKARYRLRSVNLIRAVDPSVRSTRSCPADRHDWAAAGHRCGLSLSP